MLVDLFTFWSSISPPCGEQTIMSKLLLKTKSFSNFLFLSDLNKTFKYNTIFSGVNHWSISLFPYSLISKGKVNSWKMEKIRFKGSKNFRNRNKSYSGNSSEGELLNGLFLMSPIKYVFTRSLGIAKTRHRCSFDEVWCQNKAFQIVENLPYNFFFEIYWLLV